MDITETEVLEFNSNKILSIDAEMVCFNLERDFE